MMSEVGITLPTWIKHDLRLTNFKRGIINSQSVPMDDYLVVFASGEEDWNNCNMIQADEKSVVLLAIRLQDFRVQQVRIDKRLYALSRQDSYILNRYKENQIIRFRYSSTLERKDMIDWITVESFEPFVVTLKQIFVPFKIRLKAVVTSIYQDELLVCGRDWKDEQKRLWSFDLSKETWELLETSDAGPRIYFIDLNPKMFTHNNHLYVFEAKGGITYEMSFRNLDSKEWTNLRQTDIFIQDPNLSIACSDLYRDNIVSLGKLRKVMPPFPKTFPLKEVRLCMWNLNTKSWSETETINTPSHFDLVIAQNTLFAFGKDKNQLCLYTLDMEYVVSFSEEKKRNESLFLNEKESDIKLKVQDKIIPGHIRVLTKKSLYFAHLFNSGLIELGQKTVEIDNCDYDTFQEFLKWIYCDRVELDDDLALSLLVFSNRCSQRDLEENCSKFLASSISSDNVFNILECVELQKSTLVILGIQFLTRNIEKNLVNVINYLDRPNDPHLEKYILQLRQKTMKVVMDQYGDIFRDHKKKMQFFESFLTRNVNNETVHKLSDFLVSTIHYKLMAEIAFGRAVPEKEKRGKVVFEEKTANLRIALFNFVKENIKIIQQRKISELSPVFLGQVVAYMAETSFIIEKTATKEEDIVQKVKQEEGIKEEFQVKEEEKEVRILQDSKEVEAPILMKSETKSKTKKSQKRKEPVQKEKSEEKPTLKRSKRTPKERK